MTLNQSRRSFIGAGLSAPILLATTSVGNHTTVPNDREETPLPKASQLSHRVLGRTGLKVTALGFGSMITSDGSVLERAADQGINYFDTARGYQNGNCERMVGNALKSRRNGLYISTKSHTRSKQGALDDLDTSLRELQTDYVDIWYLHAIEKGSDLTPELLEAQETAKKAGKIRFAGLSCHSGHREVVNAAVAAKHFDVALLSYNFSMGVSIDDVIHTASQAGLGVVAMKVMAGGTRSQGGSRDEKTRTILRRDGALVAALRWTLRNPEIHTTIPSMTDADQLEDNLRALAHPFSMDDGRTLESRLELISAEYCRMCGACDDQCRNGLPIADLHRFLMYSENYGQFALGREQFQMLPARLRAVRCDECSECTVHCPHGVRVMERLSRAQECFA